MTLNATDDMSGVNATYYRINNGTLETYIEPFIVKADGMYLVEFYSVDNAGNEEEINSFTIDMDQTVPDIEEVQWETFKDGGDFYVTFTCNAVDETSGMDRVEMFFNDVFYEEIVGTGPTYEFTIEWSSAFESVIFWFYHYDVAGNVIEVCPPSNPPIPGLLFITGIILNPEISEEEVTFFALMTISFDGINMYERLTFPNDYVGYIGRFFICTFFRIWI